MHIRFFGGQVKNTSEKVYKASLKRVNFLILDAFKDEDVSIILFGSRARKDFNRYSDIDIGILPRKKYDKKKWNNFHETYKNSKNKCVRKSFKKYK